MAQLTTLLWAGGVGGAVGCSYGYSLPKPNIEIALLTGAPKPDTQPSKLSAL